MTALEAVAILESAVLECKKRETSLTKGQAPGGAGVESYLLKKSLMIAMMAVIIAIIAIVLPVGAHSSCVEGFLI